MPTNPRTVSVALILACASGSALGITIRSWNSPTGGSYSTAANWQPTGVPAADDTLIFDMPGTNSWVCDALVPVTGIQQWRAGTMNWSAPSPHTVAGRFDVATLTGNVGTVRITSGEMIVAGALRVGVGSGATGTMSVDGPTALLTCPAGGQTFIGSPIARGFLNVTGGGTFVSHRSLALDSSSTLASRVLVDGAGSTMTFLGATSDLLSANQASFTNEIVVQNGGAITTEANVLLGFAPGRPGRLRVGDAAATLPSTLTIAGDLRMGDTLTALSGGFASAEFLRMSTVSVGGDIYLGDPNQGPTCTMTINQTAGGSFAVSCRDFHIGPNGVLALERGRFNVNRNLIASSGEFVLDTPTSAGNGTMVLSGAANLTTLRVATAHNASMVLNGAVNCGGGVAIGEAAGSVGELLVQNGATLTAAGTLEVARAGRAQLACGGLGAASVNELQIGSAVGGQGTVILQFGSLNCQQAAVGRFGGGSVGILDGAVSANYSCTGSTVVNIGGTINWNDGSYSSGRTVMSGGTLNARGEIGGRIAGGSGLIIATDNLTLGVAGDAEGYATGATLLVGEHRVTVVDRDGAEGNADLAGGLLDAPDGWTVPSDGAISGFGTMTRCTALGVLRPTDNGLIIIDEATSTGGIDGTDVYFNGGVTGQGVMNAKVHTAPEKAFTQTGPTTIGDGSSLGADLQGMLITNSDALILNDDDGVGGGSFGLALGFGTVFVQSVMRIDPGSVLTGVGFVDVPRLQVGGAIRPGMNGGDGIGTINTSAALRPSVRYADYYIDVAGAGEGQADAVYAAGIRLSNGTEGSTLTVREVGGYVPVPGDRIQILGGASILGEFATANLPPGWSVQYEATGVFLSYGCASDFSGDGAVDGDDVIAFFEAWDAGLIAADITGDGSTDGDDVIFFFEHWDAGC